MLICDDCGSHSVVMEQPLREGSDVVCADCGRYLGSYPDFFSDCEPSSAEHRVRVGDAVRLPEPLLLD